MRYRRAGRRTWAALGAPALVCVIIMVQAGAASAAPAAGAVGTSGVASVPVDLRPLVVALVWAVGTAVALFAVARRRARPTARAKAPRVRSAAQG